MEGLNLQSPCCGGLKGVHVTPAIDGDLKIHVWRIDELMWEGEIKGWCALCTLKLHWLKHQIYSQPSL